MQVCERGARHTSTLHYRFTTTRSLSPSLFLTPCNPRRDISYATKCSSSLSLSLALSSSVLPVRRRGVYLREGIRKCDGFDERMRFKPERPARPIQRDSRPNGRDSWPMPGTWKENQKWKGNGEKGNSRDSLCSRNDEGNTKNSNAISVSTTRIQRKSVRESPKSHRR